MLISFNWLKQYVKLADSVTPEEVAEKLKLSTVEVEGIIRQGENLDNIVIGKILKVEKHPNADKLRVCEVDLGTETVTIVCGGSNVAEGMSVIVAKSGAKVKWHGEGDLIELAPTKIRGVESNGMICGADEVGLLELFPKKDEKEIVDVTALALKPGTPVQEALHLDDVVFEIDNKSLSNRPDLWGHHGLAREVAVLFNRDVAPYKTEKIKAGNELELKVKVAASELCSKYMAVALSGVVVGESPAWLKERLNTIGIRPINNIVDATNYVMFDLGQPLHAFDAETLGAEIMVRSAKEGETFVTLDGKERKLDSSMLMIATPEKAVAIAGVMGGVESGVTNATTRVVFESANFNAASIRKTSTKLNVRTDASARFEKTLDPTWCQMALERVVSLVREMCPDAKVASNLVSVGEPELAVGPIEVAPEFFAQKIGADVPVKTIVTILERLGFGVKEKSKKLFITVPTWRATKDIAIAEDLVEEVVRVYGYDAISASMPLFPIVPPEKNPLLDLVRAITDLAVKEMSAVETYNYSFVSGLQIAKLGDDEKRYVELDNPLSKEKPFLRRSLVPNLLENVLNNAERNELRLFEAGKVFIAEEPGLRADEGGELLPSQPTHASFVFTAKKHPNPFNEARRFVEELARLIGHSVEVVAFSAVAPWQHPTRSAEVKVAGQVVGFVYEVHPLVAERCGLEHRVAVVEINVSHIVEIKKNAVEVGIYKPVSSYPAVKRDVAFVVERTVQHGEVENTLRSIDPLVIDVELFDVYEGSHVGDGKKSMAYHITYQSGERTLTTEEVDAVEKKVITALTSQFRAEIRS